MTKPDRNFQIMVLLSVQYALRGAVTPDLRAVLIVFDEQLTRMRFIYGSEITAQIRDIVSDIETLVLADLPEGFDARTVIQSIKQPEPIVPEGGEDLIFMRYEE